VPVSRFYPADKSAADLLIVAATETNTDDDIEAFAVKLEGALR
jgi:glycine dehydrogenase subunit 1